MAGKIERLRTGPAVWLREEIMDTLQAVDLANWDVAQYIDTPQARLYRRGYEAALEAIATAFGLAYAPPVRRAEGRQTPPLASEFPF